MVIDGVLRQEVREALIEAFPQGEEFLMFASEQVEAPVAEIGAREQPFAAFWVVLWASENDRLRALVASAAEVRGGYPKLQALAERFQVAPGELERVVLRSVPFLPPGS